MCTFFEVIFVYYEKYMDVCYKESTKAYLKGEVPIGAVIVKDGVVISKAYNLKETNKCSLEHAEIRAIRKACKKLDNWRLSGCDLYVTLEPCPMCASAIRQSRISNIYYCVKRDNDFNLELLSSILKDGSANSPVSLQFVNYDEKAKKIIQDFFKKRR